MNDVVHVYLFRFFTRCTRPLDEISQILFFNGSHYVTPSYNGKIYLNTCNISYFIQVYFSLNLRSLWFERVKSSKYYVFSMSVVYLTISELLAGIIYKIDSFYNLEFKYELEFVRCVFTVSLFRLMYIMTCANQLFLGIGILISKLLFKIVMYYLYPINYNTIKSFFRKYIIRCFSKNKDG